MNTVKLAGLLADIQTGHHPDTNRGSYRYTALLVTVCHKTQVHIVWFHRRANFELHIKVNIKVNINCCVGLS
jgi:hypothetical protein